jgi:hypothetical protein
LNQRNNAILLAEKIAVELGMKQAENWLITEVSQLLYSYPQLAKFIASNYGIMSILEIVQLFFEEERRRNKLQENDIYLYLRSVAWDKLHKIRLGYYLLAGISLVLAVDYCFNHRYNKDQYVRWNIDYTDSYNHYLLSCKKYGFSDDSKSEKKGKEKFTL